MAPLYGQVVAGPPGSGKTTYCNGMQQYLRLLGRNACVINLDPANEVGNSSIGHDVEEEQQEESNAKQENSQLPYDTIFDVCEDIVNLSSVMQKLDLGPNGGLVYCMEYLEAHIDDIITLIRGRIQSSSSPNSNNNNQTTTTGQVPQQPYLIIDLPGQVELYTHNTCVQTMLQKLVAAFDLRLTAVQLIDAQYCTDATKFISVALLGTTTMIRLELPMVSVLSKVDLLLNYGELPFSLEFFTDCYDLQRLTPFLEYSGNTTRCDDNQTNLAYEEENLDYTEDPGYIQARKKTRQSTFFKKREKLHQALAEVVEEFGLLSFLPLDISSAESVGRVLAKVDRCNGYIFTESNVTEDMFQCAIQSDDLSNMHLADIQERLEYEHELSAKKYNNDMH